MPRYPESDDPAVLAARVRNPYSFELPAMPDFEDDDEKDDDDEQ